MKSCIAYLNILHVSVSSDQVECLEEEPIQQYKRRHADHLEYQFHRLAGQVHPFDLARPQAVRIHELRSLDLFQRQQSQATASLPSRVDLPEVRCYVHVVVLDLG